MLVEAQKPGPAANPKPCAHLPPQGGQLLVHHTAEAVGRQLLVPRLQRGAVLDPLPHLRVRNTRTQRPV